MPTLYMHQIRKENNTNHESKKQIMIIIKNLHKLKIDVNMKDTHHFIQRNPFELLTSCILLKALV